MLAVIFATQAEAEPFLALSKAKQKTDSFAQIYSFKPPGSNREALVAICGMGLETSGHTTKKLCQDYQIAEIINAGICGALNDKLPLAEIFCISRVTETGNLDSEPRLCRTNKKSFNHLRTACLLSSEKPVFNPQEKQRLAHYGDLIDLEGAAILKEAEAQSLPCTLLKGISDLAETTGKAQIKQNLKAISENLAEIIWQELQLRNTTKIRRMLNFVKAEHTLFSLPLIFAGAWLGADKTLPDLQTLILIFTAGAGARTLGMAVNRIVDRDLDAKNPRTKNREIPSGLLTLKQGYEVAGAGLLLYLLSCLLLGRLCFLLSPIPLLPLLFYSYLKHLTSMCHFGIGLCLGLAPLGAYVAAKGSLELSSDIIFFSIFSFCWVSSFDIIYALQDLDFDRENQLLSLPVKLGSCKAQFCAALVHLVALAAILVCANLAGSTASWIFATLTGMGLGVAYLPFLPVSTRFFPFSAISGIAGACVPLFGV